MHHLIPDPINPNYAVDRKGRLYIHTILETDSGQKIDLGFKPAESRS